MGGLVIRSYVAYRGQRPGRSGATSTPLIPVGDGEICFQGDGFSVVFPATLYSRHVRTHGPGWLRYLGEVRSDVAASVLFLPYAGGSTHVFAPWFGFMPDNVRMVAVEYPGHGTRSREPRAITPDEILEPLAAAVMAEIDGPVVVFGHSLGAVLGFELAWRLESAGRPLVALIASGARAPHEYSADPGDLHLCSDQEIAMELHRRGDLPREVLRDPELCAHMMGVVKDDLTLGARYEFGSPPRRLVHPITVIGGSADPIVSVADLHAWQGVATRTPVVRVVPGGHFYFRDGLDDVADVLRRVLDARGLDMTQGSGHVRR